MKKPRELSPADQELLKAFRSRPMKNIESAWFFQALELNTEV